MKRSEMESIIKMFLDNEIDLQYMEIDNTQIIASELLDLIHFAGMLPPFVKKYKHQGNRDIFEYYKWEPEDEA